MSRQSTSQQLVRLIAQAVTDLEEDTSTQLPGATTTELNLPVVAPEDDLEATPKRRSAIRNLKGAVHQLLATLLPVGIHVEEIYYSYLQTVAIDTVIKARIADLIHSIDPESNKGGVHVHLLAQKAGMDPRKLTHILRFLAVRNIFCELNPLHWGNNRCSLPLRTDSPNSLFHLFVHMRDSVSMPALVAFPDVLLDNHGGGASSSDPNESAFQRYYKPGCDYFSWLAASEDNIKAKTFAKAMVETTRSNGTSGSAHYKAFDWKGLGSKGTLIDVGGGIGAAAYAISAHLPEWKIVIQDRPEVIQAGKEEYRNVGSKANIEFEELDFFRDQPPHRIENADAYFLRHILHDWPSHLCVQILTKLRLASKPTTRLLICETSLEPGLIEPDSPLLSNGGMATSLSHHYNLIMLSLFNAEERSREDFQELFALSGWKLQSVTTLTTFLDRFIFEGLPDPAWKEL
ncbi:hypothetical protein PGT21_012358 [Puccinia graminis f. sp. tritici]|uniref:O-methyltransferase C-terminal domain-containing protein n=2 Tax=Puccinia graminis f. sp. tritici TaxID=56615 RepID=A0A5B0MNT8_PUCGR|nr:hypothetical protein PGT21_012358 [Puccinia graminis f. sp. tritici]